MCAGHICIHTSGTALNGDLLPAFQAVPVLHLGGWLSPLQSDKVLLRGVPAGQEGKGWQPLLTEGSQKVSG